MKKKLPTRISPIFHVLALSVFLMAACSRTERIAEQKDSFTILHLSDTHVLPAGGGAPSVGRETTALRKGLLTALPEKVGAEAVAITGDMVDSWEIESVEGNLRANQVDRFAAASSPVHKNVIEDIPLPAGHRVTQAETGAFALNADKLESD